MSNVKKDELLRLTDARIDSNTELQSFVEKARSLTIPIFPETVQFTEPEFKFGAALVTVDTVLNNGSNRDIYKNSDGSFCLHLSKINEIAQQAGVIVTDSRILERKTDQTGKVTFIEHQVKGKMKSVDGSIKEDVATGKYDYFRDLEKYVKNGQPILGMINGRRSHAEALAESNAKTRLFNKLVAKLPSSFTLDELKKPFLIPYVIEDRNALINLLPKDQRDKVRTEMVRKRLGISDAIYSPPAAEDKTVEDAQIISDEDKKTETAELSREEKNHIDAETYREAPQPELTNKILEYCKKTNTTNPGGKPVIAGQIEAKSRDEQIKFLEALFNKAEDTVSENDDLPF